MYDTGSGFRFDRTAILSVSLVILGCAVMLGLWPLVKRLLTPSTPVAGRPIIDDYKNKFNIGSNFQKALDDSMPVVNAPVEHSQPPPAPSSAPPTFYALNGHAFRPQIAPAPQPIAPTQINLAGNFEQNARGTFDTFLAQYCYQRSEQIKCRVMPTSILWLPSGVGAVVSLDEQGKFRQGTAQFNPQVGWGWIVSPA